MELGATLVLFTLIIILKVFIAYANVSDADDYGLNKSEWFWKCFFTRFAHREYEIEKAAIIAGRQHYEYHKAEEMKIQKERSKLEAEKKALFDLTNLQEFITKTYYQKAPFFIDRYRIYYEGGFKIVLYLHDRANKIKALKGIVNVYSEDKGLQSFENVMIEFQSAEAPKASVPFMLETRHEDWPKKIIDVVMDIQAYIDTDYQRHEFDAERVTYSLPMVEIAKIKRIYGFDAVIAPVLTETQWQCCCGEENQAERCTHCARSKEQLIDRNSIHTIIEGIKSCDSISDLSILIQEHEHLIEPEQLKQVQSKLAQDKQIKRLYGIANEKAEILKYVELLA